MTQEQLGLHKLLSQPRPCEVQTVRHCNYLSIKNLIHLWYSCISSNVNNVLETKACNIIAYYSYRFVLCVPEIGLGKSLSQMEKNFAISWKIIQNTNRLQGKGIYNV
jgi:hypothetical protein